jgi:hypothetical protein
MIPQTRPDFIEYCLRALGKPVLQINVDMEQVEDRVDEALYLYQQFHMDAVIKTYLKHEVTASTLTFTGASSVPFANNELVRGLTSNATGMVVAVPSPLTLDHYMMSKSFLIGETVEGTQSGASAVVANNVLGDMDNGYFEIPPGIISVTKMFPPFDGRVSSEILFDPQAQFNISLLSNFTSNSIIPYYIGRSYQQLLNDVFRGRPGVRFQRHMNRIYVDLNWRATFRPGQFIIIEGYMVIDPDAYPDVWSDRWLQKYAIALIKRQWGLNTSKYQGVQLPGGVTLDGRSMLNEANQEIKDLELELQNAFQEPPDFIVG